MEQGILLHEALVRGPERGDLGLGVHHPRKPARDITDRREDLARPGLDRRQHLGDAALDRVQRAARRLAEVGGQQDQGCADEEHEDRAPASYLLVMHSCSISKTMPAPALAAAPVARILMRPVDRLELLERAPGPDRDARQR